MKAGILIVVALMIATTAASAFGDGSLIVRNNSDCSAELWIWPRSVQRYLRPRMYLMPKSERGLTYRDGEVYWLVARDDHLREFPVGWVNIGQKLRENPGSQLHVQQVFETRIVMQECDICRWDCRLRRWIRDTQVRTYACPVGYLIWHWETPQQPNHQRPSAVP